MWKFHKKVEKISPRDDRLRFKEVHVAEDLALQKGDCAAGAPGLMEVREPPPLSPKRGKGTGNLRIVSVNLTEFMVNGTIQKPFTDIF